MVKHFNSIDEVLTLLQKDVVAGEMQQLFPLHSKYEYLWAAGGSLVPSIGSSFISPFVYRGQITRYQPCLPGVFRGLSAEVDRAIGWSSLSFPERAKLFVERVRLEEFVMALRDHPASAYAHEIGLRLDPFGLAQHYEMVTDRIDLTLDHLVAAFFATNMRSGDEWVPARDGVGVFYRLHTASMYESRQEHFVCIGKQTFPRPGEQKAFSLTLPLSYDFERLPVEVFTFQHAESCGRRLNDHFKGGALLFPPDVMAEVAQAIRLERSIPRQIATWLLGYDKTSREVLADSLGQFEDLLARHSDFRVSERDRITLTVAQQERALVGVEGMKSNFLEGVGAIAVRRAQECS